MSEEKKVRIMKANRMLQSKVGMGSIAEEKIEESQEVIDHNNVDFVPMAKDYLLDLEKAMDFAKKRLKENEEEKNEDVTALLQAMIDPVMQLKANATMFDYSLVGGLASIMLDFLEILETIDQDIIDVVEAHQSSLRIIMSSKTLRNIDSPEGQALQKELKDACRRYFIKHASERYTDPNKR